MNVLLSSIVSGLQFSFDHCTVPGLVICGVLGVLSICMWTLLASKWHFLARSEQADRKFMREFRDSPHLLAIYLTKTRVERSPLHHIYHLATRELAWHMVGEEEPGRTFSSRLQGAGRINPSQMRAVMAAMERGVAEAALRLEARVGGVATCLTVAPIMGVLGTVWGILDIFAALAQAGQASMALILPGIAAALLTTVAGLVVSVPCLLVYNMIVGRIRRMVAHLENFAGELTGLLDRQFVDHRAQEPALPSLGNLGAPVMPTFGNSTTTPATTRSSRLSQPTPA